MKGRGSTGPGGVVQGPIEELRGTKRNWIQLSKKVLRDNVRRNACAIWE